MNNSQLRHAHIWLRPTAVWAALVLLGLASLGSAYLPLNAFNTPLNLTIAGIMVILLWLFLMGLIGSDALLRLIAVAGFQRLFHSRLRRPTRPAARILC